jgi:hypothetical protein
MEHCNGSMRFQNIFIPIMALSFAMGGYFSYSHPLYMVYPDLLCQKPGTDFY